MPAEETRIDRQRAWTQKRYSSLDGGNEKEMVNKVSVRQVCNRGKRDPQVY